MKNLKERFVAAGTLFVFAVFTLFIMQWIYPTDTMASRSLFSLCYFLGSFFYGFTFYYRRLLRVDKNNHPPSTKVEYFTCLFAYVWGMVCTVIFSLVSFFAHTNSQAVLAQYGYHHALRQIISTTFAKTSDGFMQIAVHHYGLALMIVMTVVAQYSLMKIRDKMISPRYTLPQAELDETTA